jgi:hypothetical protein
MEFQINSNKELVEKLLKINILNAALSEIFIRRRSQIISKGTCNKVISIANKTVSTLKLIIWLWRLFKRMAPR